GADDIPHAQNAFFSGKQGGRMKKKQQVYDAAQHPVHGRASIFVLVENVLAGNLCETKLNTYLRQHASPVLQQCVIAWLIAPPAGFSVPRTPRRRTRPPGSRTGSGRAPRSPP